MLTPSGRSSYSVVSLEWAGPGVGGGVIFPFSVSVGFALEFLFSDVFICVFNSRDSCEDCEEGEFHFDYLTNLIYNNSPHGFYKIFYSVNSASIFIF